MVAVAFLLLWGGYSLGEFGWCLFRDYDITLGQLMSPFHPYTGAWPPAKIPAGQTWPGGRATQTAAGNIGGLIAQGAESAAAASVTNSTKTG